MPGLDKTGPLGEGPMTGRKMGFLGGGRRNFCRGRRFGGRNCWFWPFRKELSKEEELKILEEDASAVEKELTLMKDRMEELKKDKDN